MKSIQLSKQWKYRIYAIIIAVPLVLWAILSWFPIYELRERYICFKVGTIMPVSDWDAAINNKDNIFSQ
ncbi:MAG: hypothetical protein ACFE8B_02660, partial [Candidatus Hermodarchaeota archaeon]